MTLSGQLALAGMAHAQGGLSPDVRGQVITRDAAVLSSEIAGRISALPFREGEKFAKGDELVGIDCASYRAKLDEADAQMRRAERKLQAFRVLDRRGATGKADLDLAEIDADAARAIRETAAIDVSRCSITAPFDGAVAEQKVKRHQYVTVGEPVIDILSAEALELELLAPSRWLSWLEIGSGFSMRIDELERGFPAVVTRLGARIDPVSQSVKIYARVEGDTADLLPGMSGIAHFSGDSQAPAQ